MSSINTRSFAGRRCGCWPAAASKPQSWSIFQQPEEQGSISFWEPPDYLALIIVRGDTQRILMLTDPMWKVGSILNCLEP